MFTARSQATDLISSRGFDHKQVFGPYADSAGQTIDFLLTAKRDAESAKRIAQTADAVVIGSRIIQEIEAGAADQAVTRVKQFLAPIRKALDS